MEKEKWGAVLDGHVFDLSDWSEALLPPNDPWVEKWTIGDTERFILMSRDFGDMKDLQEAYERASLLITKLNGAFLTRPDTQSVTLQGVAERSPDGTFRQMVSAAVGSAHGRGRAGAISFGNNAPNGPSTVQRWIALADRNELVDDLLMHQSKPSNWYDLYKVFEDVRELCGKALPLSKRSWCPSERDLKNFSHTANYFRHSLAHPARRSPPSTPMTLEEARTLVRVMITGVLADLSDNDPSSSENIPA
jgi:hypothetical protein